MREATMLPLLRRMLTDAVTFCAFENNRGTDDNPTVSPGTAIGVRKFDCKFKKKGIIVSMSYKQKVVN
jgi:hypothetical protein